MLVKIAGPGFDKPDDVIKRLAEKRLKYDYRELVLLGAEFIYNKDWIGQCQSAHDREIMRERQEQIKRILNRRFTKTRANNLIDRKSVV